MGEDWGRHPIGGPLVRDNVFEVGEDEGGTDTLRDHEIFYNKS